MTDTKELLKIIVKGIEEKKGDDIKILNLKNTNGAICEYFVICNGGTNIQVEAIADSILYTVKKETGENVSSKQGYENAQWVLLDYFNIVVHIFQTEYREFYNLEGLWADAEIEG